MTGEAAAHTGSVAGSPSHAPHLSNPHIPLGARGPNSGKLASAQPGALHPDVTLLGHPGH